MREDARTKARRLLGEGRVTVRCLGPDVIVARVRGDSAREYSVAWDPVGWSCPCAALGRCSHIIATQLVVLEPLPATAPRPSDAPTGRSSADG
jgi:uncharacterized Zn finger protein